VLVRALRTQSRLDILSRPQVMTADNQTAYILSGQYFPYVTSSVVSTGITGIPTVTNSISYRNTGVQLTVTPKINPDGSIIMHVIPEVSSPTNTNVNLGNGVTATAFNTQTVETTIVAVDGETVVLGGLMAVKDLKQENRIPWFGDLPGVGALFRSRTQIKSKTELLIILTPHIVRSRADADRILAMESKRMDWLVGTVLKMHGASGMEPVLGPPKNGQGADGSCASGVGAAEPPVTVPIMPGMPSTTTPPAAAPTAPPTTPEPLPPPRKVTEAVSPTQAPVLVGVPAGPGTAPVIQTLAVEASVPPAEPQAPPAEPKRRWFSLFR
jgi:hypothetical protein